MLKVKRQVGEAQKEELSRLWEDTDRKLERERVPNQADWKNEDRQRGSAMHSNELIRRIVKMNPRIWVEDSINYKGNAGFYYMGKDGLKACCQAPFEKGMVLEFTRVFVDTADRPVGVRYGWREILHRLMKLKLITWEQVKTGFPMYESIRSEPFDRKTQELKN